MPKILDIDRYNNIRVLGEFTESTAITNTTLDRYGNLTIPGEFTENDQVKITYDRYGNINNGGELYEVDGL